MGTAKLLHKPLYWAWAFVILWTLYVLYGVYVAEPPAVTIGLGGLVASLLVLKAIHGRSRRDLYPGSES